MAFPSNPKTNDTHTNEKGITFRYNEKGAWEVKSINNGAINYTISDTAPIEPVLGDQWWDTTNSVLKSWATDGTGYFWTPIGGPNENSPIVSDTPPIGPQIGDGWYYKGDLYIYLNVNNVNQWVPVSSTQDVQRAMPIIWGYSEEAFNVELFTGSKAYTWRNFDAVKITSVQNGDDTVRVESTANIFPDEEYVITNANGDNVAIVAVLNVLNATTFRAKTTLSITYDQDSGATLSKTSFDLRTPTRAVVSDGDVLISKPLTALKLRNGLIYIRRTATGQGTFKVQYRPKGTVTWIEAPFITSENVEGDSSVRDESYEVLATGTIEARVFYTATQGSFETLYHIVLAVKKQNIENSRVAKPNNVTPADQASDISATPTLILSSYKSLYGIEQGGAEFQVAEDRNFANLRFSSSTNFLAGWIAVTGETAVFNDALLYSDDKGIAVGNAGAIRKTTNAGKTFTAGATGESDNLFAVAHNGVSRFFFVGANATLLYSDNEGTTINPISLPDGFTGSLNDVVAQGNVSVVVGASARIYRSGNNGTIYSLISPANAYAGTFNVVLMNTSGTVVIAGSNGEIQTSNNFGIDFVKRNPPGGYSGTYRGGAITDNGIVILVGDNGAIHKSTDYGATYLAKTAAESYVSQFNEVAISDKYVIVGGVNGEVQTSEDYGDIYYSRNLAGATTQSINGVALNSTTLKAFVVGAAGTVQTALRLEGAVSQVTVPAGDDLLKVNKVYWWRGRYIDSLGYPSEWSNPTAFATQSNFSYVGQPSNLSPASNASNIPSLPTLQASPFNFYGDNDTHAFSRWQITTDGFATTVYDSGNVADKTQHTIPGSSQLSQNQDYTWRVKYIGASGRESAWSIPSKFTVVSKPNTPSIIAPTQNATNVSRNPTIQTSSYSIPGNTPPHTSSQYQISSDQDFGSTVYDSGAVTDLTTHIVTATTLNNLTEYYVRARHRGDSTSWSEWSPSRKFTTIASAAAPAIAGFNNGKSAGNFKTDTIGYDTTTNNFTFNVDPDNFTPANSSDQIVDSYIQISRNAGFTDLFNFGIATPVAGTNALLLPQKDGVSLITLAGTVNIPKFGTVYARVAHRGTLSGFTGWGSVKTIAVEGPVGEQVYGGPGTYNFTVPAGITSLAVMLASAAANSTSSAGGGGGAVGYKNNIAVTPGQVIPVEVGANGPNGGRSLFGSLIIPGAVAATGAILPAGFDGGGNGGNGGNRFSSYGGGGGSAGRYDRAGGNGSGYTSQQVPHTTSSLQASVTNQTSFASGTYRGEAYSSGDTSGSGGAGSSYTQTTLQNVENRPSGTVWIYYVTTFTWQNVSSTTYTTDYSSTSPTGTAGQGRGGIAGTRGEGIDVKGSNVSPTLSSGYAAGGAAPSGNGIGGVVRVIWGSGVSFPTNAG